MLSHQWICPARMNKLATRLHRVLTDWEGAPPLSFAGVAGFDTTLPAGHTWNIGFEDPLPDSQRGSLNAVAADSAGVTIEPSDSSPCARVAGPTCIQALIYAPDFIPEIITVQVSLPVTVVHFLNALSPQRLEPQAQCFPELFPAAPQPIQELAVIVAAPEWQAETVVVLFDCRRSNECLFACVVHRLLSRESLLIAAGFPMDAALHVYVHGLIHPLSVDQKITLKSGMTVCIVPRAEGAPICYDLASRLATDEGWDADAPIPGPRTHFESHFYVLADGRPFPFSIARGRRPHFREDLAHSLGAQLHALTIKASTPRISDSFTFGYWASGVVVATEALLRVPFPPARHPELRSILILDQRRILRGFRWLLVEGLEVSVDSLFSLYRDMCPFRHSVDISGAPIVEREPGPVFTVRHGQVLIVSFRPWDLLGGSQEIPDTRDRPPSNRGDDLDDPPPDPGTDSPPDAGQNPDIRRRRSRTPRKPGGGGNSQSLSS